MHKSLAPGLLVVALIGAGCGLTDTPPPRTRTPRPTITATFAPTSTTAPTESIALTDTPVPPVTDSLASLTASALPADTAIPSVTPTRRPVVQQPTPAPLTVTNILLVAVERDPARDNGAIASLQVVYTGGLAPYTIFHDDTLQPGNPFKVLTVCHGTLVHTIRLTSGDRQIVTKVYYLWPVDCPP